MHRRVIDLTDATLEQLVEAVFRTSDLPRDPDGNATEWVDFRVDPTRQLVLATELFRRAGGLLDQFSTAQIERGLWRIMGGEYSELFTDHLWDPTVPLAARLGAVGAIDDLYRELLARPPYEPVDFQHPDRLPRRFETIDYMVPDLLLHAPAFVEGTEADRAAMRDAFQATFRRLLQHPAPIAQYAALHGLGHLDHSRRAPVIAAYLSQRSDLSPDQRAYAEKAQRGEVL